MNVSPKKTIYRSLRTNVSTSLALMYFQQGICRSLYCFFVPGKNFVSSIFDKIEFLFIFTLLEKIAFHCVFKINIRLLVFYDEFFLLTKQKKIEVVSSFLVSIVNYQKTLTLFSIFYKLNILVIYNVLAWNGSALLK